MAQISMRTLAHLCRRVAVSLEAGIEIRRVWQKEGLNGGPIQQRHASDVLRRINEGETLSDAMSACGGYYPGLVCEMVRVGEETGRLEAVFLKLAEHYDHLLELRRTVLTGLALPTLELCGAIGIIGLMILVTAMLGLDPFQIGISGMPLFYAYAALVVLGVTAIAVPLVGLQRGWFGSAPLAVAMRVPVIGGCVRMMALSRMAWSLAMAIDAGMDVRRSMRLALQSTQNPYYLSHAESADATLEAGGEINEALRKAGEYPPEFLEVLVTGELTGQVSEVLVRLSDDYRRRVEATLRMLAAVLGVVAVLTVGLIIGGVVIMMAKRLYIDPLNDAIYNTY